MYGRKTSRIGDYIFTLSNMVKVLSHNHQQSQSDFVDELEDLIDELNIGMTFVSTTCTALKSYKFGL